ncbi:MAG: acyl-CoA dehydrogenase family protein, partial [Steroidobacteraceae bacterium]
MDNADIAVAKRRADLMSSDFGLPLEVIEVRAEVRAFAEKVLRPCSMELNTRVESRDAFPRQILQAMAEAGICAIPFPADVGGRGLTNPTLALVVALEEIGYFSAGIASALGDGQLILVGQTLNRASPDLRMRYLPLIVGGKIVCSFATSEPAASTDLSPDSMKTVATKVEGGWRINGRKRWITNAVAADIILVLCKTGERSQSMLLVETRNNGVTVYDPDLKMGNHPQLTSDVLFENSFAPDKNVVGAVDSGLRAALGALTAGRVGIGAIGVAMAQAAFDLACDHMERRSVFGKELARYQHWQFTFADHAIAIEQARLLYYKAAAMLDGGHLADVESAMAKVAGSRLAVDVARDAVQVCGAYGFVKQLSATGERRAVEAIYRDSKIGEIYEGANEVQKWIIARRIF